jgi:hypothetical protein
MALGLDALLKSFAADGDGSIRIDADGIGINDSLCDVLLEEGRLAIQARRLGIRVAVPGIDDTPESRLLIDGIQDDDEAIEQLHSLLQDVTGAIRTYEIQTAATVQINSLALLHLLPHCPMLSISAIAALHCPTDLRRRADVAQWIRRDAMRGDVFHATFRDKFILVHRLDYLSYPHRLQGSQWLDAWLGTLSTVFQE